MANVIGDDDLSKVDNLQTNVANMFNEFKV